MEQFVLALWLSLLAGLSTTIGCFIALLVKKPNPQFLSVIMGFSAGVMLLISFVELLQEGIETNGFIGGMLFFFLGMIIMFILDITISHQYEFEDTIEVLANGKTCVASPPKKTKKQRRKAKKSQIMVKKQEGLVIAGVSADGDQINLDDNGIKVDLQKTSLLVFLGVFLHNIPEGMATFIGTMTSIELGVILALAIALHNIPEGIAVAVPIFTCTGNRKKAFAWSFISGISEFLGAIAVGLVLFPFINDVILGVMLAIVAGLMVYVSVDELLPVSHSLGKEHYSIIGLMAGMFVMALTLVFV